MSDHRHIWTGPVFIRLPHALASEPVNNAYEALDVLLQRWPHPANKAYDEATKICSRATEGRVGCGLARVVFIAAAREAGIHVDDGKAQKTEFGR